MLPKSPLLYTPFAMHADQPAPVNRCGYCGAASYRPVVERDAAGAMRYAARLVCSGCSREFTDLSTWRLGSHGAPPPAAAAV